MTRHFGNFIESYVSYTRNQETSEKIHRWTAISIIAGALERKVTLDRGYFTLFPNLYTIIIGPSGIVRKSTSTGIGVDLLRNLDNINLMSERVTAASLIAQLGRAQRQYAVTGMTRNQSAVYCYASELQVFMNEVFGSISELLTTFYDCSPHDDSKPWIYENKGEGETLIYGPCLNLLGASTATWLRRAIPISEQEGGFSSRIIFVVENDPPRQFVAFPRVDAELASMRPRLIQDLQHIHGLSGRMSLTTDAEAWGTRWYETNQRNLMARQEARFAGYFGRKFETVLKVAISLSVAESDDLIIREEHMVKAASMLEQLEITMFEAFGNSGKHRHVEELAKIVDLLRKGPGATTHAALLRAFHRDLDHKNLVELMQSLANMKAIRVFTQPTPYGGVDISYQLSDADFRL